MSKNLPSPNDKSSDGSSKGSNQYLSVGEYHYHGNDLKELKELAEKNPDLAHKIVELEDKRNERAVSSYKFGLIATIGLLITATISITLVTVYAGLLTTFLLTGLLLTIALLVRVILTGKWSDTSWFGKLVTGLVKILGGKNTEED